MKIRNHRLDGAAFRAARLTGPVIRPEVVILHDTAGRLGNGSSVDWLATSSGASAHFVVAIGGEVTQLVPTNRRAGHAGRSHYHGRDDVNGFSIGIEIENPGRLVPVGNGFGRAWYGETFADTVEMTTPEHGAGAWLPYPPAQIAAVETLLHALFAGIRSLRDIRTHWYVSPGRKVDTSPLFPLEALRARVLGRDDPSDIAADDASRTEPRTAWIEVATGGAGLNLRRWPSFNPNVIATIPTGTQLPVLRHGTFAGQDWYQVRFDGREGWIVALYTSPVN